jgi:hypothetical protein
MGMWGVSSTVLLGGPHAGLFCVNALMLFLLAAAILPFACIHVESVPMLGGGVVACGVGRGGVLAERADGETTGRRA